MAYERKKRSVQGEPFTDKDTQILARLFQKYGESSFDAACQKVRTLKKRQAGREQHSEANLFTVYLAMRESVDEIGIEKTCTTLSGQVRSVTGKAYTAGGLKTLFRRAKTLIEKQPKLKEQAKLFEDLRSGRVLPMMTIGDTIPPFPNGPIAPVLVKRK